MKFVSEIYFEEKFIIPKYYQQIYWSVEIQRAKTTFKATQFRKVFSDHNQSSRISGRDYVFEKKNATRIAIAVLCLLLAKVTFVNNRIEALTINLFQPVTHNRTTQSAANTHTHIHHTYTQCKYLQERIRQRLAFLLIEPHEAEIFRFQPTKIDIEGWDWVSSSTTTKCKVRRTEPQK